MYLIETTEIYRVDSEDEAKKCLKFNTVLNTFTNSEGYISVFPCAICGRNDYTPRAKKGKINGK